MTAITFPDTLRTNELNIRFAAHFLYLTATHTLFCKQSWNTNELDKPGLVRRTGSDAHWLVLNVGLSVYNIAVGCPDRLRAKDINLDKQMPRARHDADKPTRAAQFKAYCSAIVETNRAHSAEVSMAEVVRSSAFDLAQVKLAAPPQFVSWFVRQLARGIQRLQLRSRPRS